MSELERELVRLRAQIAQAKEDAKQAVERRKQAVERRKQAEEDTKQAVERRKQAEAKVKKTTFLQYLHNVQTIIIPDLVVETKTTSQSSGTVTNVFGKVYPRVFRRWNAFPALCDKRFDEFVKMFGEEQLFPSLYAVEWVKSELSSDSKEDEQDMRGFIRAYAERPAMRIVNRFTRNQDTRFRFSNNAYSLHPKQSSQEGESQPLTKKTSPKRVGGVPDRWGILVTADGNWTMALVGEYKAAHKAQGKSFRMVLGTGQTFPETLFADCARHLGLETQPPPTETQAPTEPQAEPNNDAAASSRPSPQRIMAAKVLCQTYHYMVISGLAYGYAASGDCMIFLFIPDGQPDTLLVHLLDERPTVQSPQKSHATQLATLALLALEAETPPAQWILDAELGLPRWPSSKGKKGDAPSTMTGDDIPSLPPPTTSSCHATPPTGNRRREEDDDDGDDAPHGHGSGAHTQVLTAKRKRAAACSPLGGGGRDRPAGRSSPYEGYCTQACLLGLCRDGSFDPACPNTPTHSGQGRWLRHPVSASEVCSRVRDRLAHNLDDGCECLDKYGMFGATGCLFRITDPTYGYVFVAKGVQEVDTHVLFEEASVYTHCLELQGTRIPVYLGIIELVYHYPLCSTAAVTDMMLLFWAGRSLASRTTTARQVSEGEIDTAVELLERHGIEHDDIREANLTWNDEVGGVMVIDFDRAFIHGPAKKQRMTEVVASG